MQATNIYLPPTPVKTETKPVSPQKSSSREKDFGQVLKTTRQDQKQDTKQDKPLQTEKVDKPVTEQKPEEKTDEKQDTKNPQDTLQLTQIVNGIPIIVVNQDLANGQGKDAQTGNEQNISSSQSMTPVTLQGGTAANGNDLVTNQMSQPSCSFTQVMVDNLNQQQPQTSNSLGQVVLGTQDQGENIVIQTQQEVKTGSQLSAVLENGRPIIQNPINPIQQENKTTNTVNQSANLEENSLVPVFNNQAELSEPTTENKPGTKVEGAKEFWQALAGKVEVKDTTGFGGNNQSKQGDSKPDSQSNFTPALSPVSSQSITETHQVKENFAKNLQSLDNDILQQVIQKVQVNLKPGQTEMRMQLKPEHLGEVQMKLAIEDGKVSAQFLTNSQNAKDALEGNLVQLKQSLQDQGIKVEKLSVLIGGGNLQFNQGRKEETFTNQQKVAKNWRKVSGDNYEVADVSVVESGRSQILSSDQVDYKA